MPKQAPYARIAITLPESELAAADRLAKQHDRSRSWIVAEAVRCYAASEVRSSSTSDIGSSRRAQLQRDLALTPEERVRIAEQTARLQAGNAEPRRFATFDDYLASRRASAPSR
jgi:hypothetical protein